MLDPQVMALALTYVSENHTPASSDKVTLDSVWNLVDLRFKDEMHRLPTTSAEIECFTRNILNEMHGNNLSVIIKPLSEARRDDEVQHELALMAQHEATARSKAKMARDRELIHIIEQRPVHPSAVFAG